MFLGGGRLERRAAELGERRERRFEPAPDQHRQEPEDQDPFDTAENETPNVCVTPHPPARINN